MRPISAHSPPDPKEPIPFNEPDADNPYPATLSAGTVNANVQTTGVAASGQLVASWSDDDDATFQASTLTAGVATVIGQNGQAIGTGPVPFERQRPTDHSERQNQLRHHRPGQSLVLRPVRQSAWASAATGKSTRRPSPAR